MNPYEYIKNAIIVGDYEPGKRLIEEELAETLQVSRTPIREAIKQLKSEGLITPLKRGVMVREFTKNDIRQIYDLRAILESYAANQAAYNRNDTDLENLNKANERYKSVINNKNNSPKLTVVNEIGRAHV